MMELYSGLPDNVVGVKASGNVDAHDYEAVLIPALDDALKKHSQLRVLYHLTSEFTGFTSGAIWDDSKVGLTYWKAWEKIAVVTDNQWIAHSMQLFAFLVPGKVKVFRNPELAEAKEWIAA